MSAGSTHLERQIPSWVRRALRLPLFWKLLLANVLFVALAGAAVAWAVDRGVVTLAPAVAAFVVALGTLVIAALASALVVRLALRPVDTLADVARRVRAGDSTARVPTSLLADRRLERLQHVVNEMLDAVTVAHRRQRELSRRVLEAEERERERIAHELYAGTAQTLAGVLVRLRILAREGNVVTEQSIDELTDQVRDALEEIRSVARRLRPPELDEIGVRAALEAHARGLAEAHGLRIDFHGRVPETCLSDEARLALFRVIQEGLSNAAIHANASHVHTRFVRAADALVVEVEDDGCGFDPDDPRLLAPIAGAGLGLPGMRERAGYAGGSLTVDAAPGRGTRLRLLLPWATPPGTDDTLAGTSSATRVAHEGVPT
jgi:signal transduction histidine kinase